MSPIAGMPKACRNVPVEPPLSETVTIAVMSIVSSPCSLSFLSPLSRTGRPVPPPMPTILIGPLQQKQP